MGKLPYIPNKNLYAAVMGACKWIREDGYFNKATKYYADKYNVSVDEVKKYVRIAQGNGQREANKRKPTKRYFWYAIEYGYYNYKQLDYGVDIYDRTFSTFDVKRALSKDSLKRTMTKNEGYGEYSDHKIFHRIEGFTTKEEAVKAMNSWYEEWKREYRKE